MSADAPASRPEEQHVNLDSVATWPSEIRRAIDAIASVFLMTYIVARDRALESPSKDVQEAARSDKANAEALQWRTRYEILRRRLEKLPRSRRPRYEVDDKVRILEFMWANGLAVEEAAKQFVVHPNSIRRWRDAFKKGGKKALGCVP